jgi:hypothetical protein
MDCGEGGRGGGRESLNFFVFFFFFSFFSSFFSFSYFHFRYEICVAVCVEEGYLSIKHNDKMIAVWRWDPFDGIRLLIIEHKF